MKEERPTIIETTPGYDQQKINEATKEMQKYIQEGWENIEVEEATQFVTGDLYFLVRSIYLSNP